MKIKKITFASFIFIASFALNNTIMPMEKSKQIPLKLYNLEILLSQEILQQNDIPALKEEMEKKAAILQQKDKITAQKNKIVNHTYDKYNACTKKRNKETETLYFWQPYTVDCDSLIKAYRKATDELSEAHNEYAEAFKAYSKAHEAWSKRTEETIERAEEIIEWNKK